MTAAYATILLFALLLMGIPVGFAIGIAGSVGLYLTGGMPVLLGVLENTPHTTVSTHVLMTIPMFILMAEFVVVSGVAAELFDAARIWVGKTPAGLGIATTLSGAAFAAISGSSTAGAATLASTSIPQMAKHGYDQRVANGIAAVVGTLAMMIPPSIALILYAILAEQSVGKLLIAGLIPGLLIALALIITLLFLVWRNPSLAPSTQSFPFLEKLKALKLSGPFLVLFILVLGTIYSGVATPTEASAFGAFGALCLTFIRRKLTWRLMFEALFRTASVTTMILMMLVGAYVFGYFLTATQVTQELVAFVGGLNVPPLIIFAIISSIYITLGFFMDQVAILALTVPVVLPLIETLGFSPIWFGVMIVLYAEIGMVTPPFGMNVFVVSRYTGRPAEEVFAGVWPYVITLLLVAVLLTLVPGLVTWAPNTMAQ